MGLKIKTTRTKNMELACGWYIYGPLNWFRGFDHQLEHLSR